jgi:colanic acid biosynthesis glycosyl transferase WcaI
MPSGSRLAGLRVLVVGINYAPESTGIGPYTSQACEHLAASGAEVLVLTGVPHYPHWTVPSNYKRSLRQEGLAGPVRIRRLRHYVPRRQSAASRSLYEGTFGLHAACQRLPWKPDAVLCVTPSLFGAIAGWTLARRHATPMVVWVQDLTGPAAVQSGIRGGRGVASLVASLERWLLRRAQVIVVVSGAIERYVARDARSARVNVIPNWTHIRTPLDNRAVVRRRLGWRENETIVVHSGNMGLKQGLVNVIRTAELSAAIQGDIRFVLIGDGSQRRQLEIRSAGVAALQMLPPVAAEEFPDVLAAADVLLINERSSVFDMSLPSKLTSYFCAGVPVVGAVPGGGGTACEIERSGAGVVVDPDDPDALLAAIRTLARDPDLRDELSRAGRRYASSHLDRGVALDQLAQLVGEAASLGDRGTRFRSVGYLRWKRRR